MKHEDNIKFLFLFQISYSLFRHKATKMFNKIINAKRMMYNNMIIIVKILLRLKIYK